MTYTFLSNSRDYNDWTTEPMIMENFEPIEHKLFSNDTFEINNENVTILDSQTRDYKSHCGILILQGNKTFGKAAKGRLYYKCIPNDKTLPVFLIPYELRIGFSKNHMNKYVTFKFNNLNIKIEQVPTFEVYNLSLEIDISPVSTYLHELSLSSHTLRNLIFIFNII